MIEKYIRNLLFEHDCVVIPDFGGFIANYVGAEIHPIHHTFAPPSKNIAFNEMLKLNDGLLISHVATHEGISREEAQKAVKDYTESIKNEIRSKEKYKFAEIGTLYLSHEQKLQFEPENKINYLSSSFGLPPMDYKPIERVTGYGKFKTKDRPAMNNEDLLTEEEEQLLLPVEKKRSRSWIVLAIVIPVLLSLAGSAGYFLFLDNGKTALSSFDPFVSLKSKNVEEDTTTVVDDSFLYADTTLQTSLISNDSALATNEEDWSTATPTQEASTVHPETNVEELYKTADQDANTNVKPSETLPATSVTKSSSETANDIAVASATSRFYVIVGGFSVEENAYKLKDELLAKGNNQAKVILPRKAGNMLKVSYADFNTFDTASLKASELKDEFGDAVWVLKY